MADFAWLSTPQAEGKFFRTVETLSDLTKEWARLEKQVRLTALLTFLGASIILAGGFPEGTTVELLGVIVPASLISLQLLAVFVAGSFGLMLRMMGSWLVVRGMIDKLLEVLPAGQEFFVARYDASHLFINTIKPRRVGYESPLPHTVIVLLSGASGLFLFFLQVAIAGAALWKALSSAWDTTGPFSFLFFISLAAAASAATMLLAFLFAFLVPLPYRASQAMKDYWAKHNVEAESSPSVPASEVVESR